MAAAGKPFPAERSERGFFKGSVTEWPNKGSVSGHRPHDRTAGVCARPRGGGPAHLCGGAPAQRGSPDAQTRPSELGNGHEP